MHCFRNFHRMIPILHFPPPSLFKPKVPPTSLCRGLLQAYGRNSLPGFRTFCTSQDLTAKKCVPCNTKELRPMTEEAANSLIPQVTGWDLVKEDGILKLRQSWKVKTFTKALEFFRIVAELAEAEGHHPDLHLVGWNNVTIEIWTHAVGGLTENDFILAAKITGLDVHQLLRRKASESSQCLLAAAENHQHSSSDYIDDDDHDDMLPQFSQKYKCDCRERPY
ncbi:hypothetical protein L6164_035440 [Bauhinia variegata]|uniref:Uncharacterized protein n=1 Tax=Bauhinia variegata TaxID=167791 RepID=A0ACB9KDZ0_BAUVA|nr:hypothetical protein L6164_035440 [Bauhinia variegata]